MGPIRSSLLGKTRHGTFSGGVSMPVTSSIVVFIGNGIAGGLLASNELCRLGGKGGIGCWWLILSPAAASFSGEGRFRNEKIDFDVAFLREKDRCN